MLHEINLITQEYGFPLTHEDAAAYLANIAEGIAAIASNDASHTSIQGALKRAPCGHLPAPQHNRRHAWAWKSSIGEIEAGPLDGKRIAIRRPMLFGERTPRNQASS